MKLLQNETPQRIERGSYVSLETFPECNFLDARQISYETERRFLKVKPSTKESLHDHISHDRHCCGPDCAQSLRRRRNSHDRHRCRRCGCSGAFRGRQQRRPRRQSRSSRKDALPRRRFRRLRRAVRHPGERPAEGQGRQVRSAPGSRLRPDRQRPPAQRPYDAQGSRRTVARRGELGHQALRSKVHRSASAVPRRIPVRSLSLPCRRLRTDVPVRAQGLERQRREDPHEHQGRRIDR